MNTDAIVSYPPWNSMQMGIEDDPIMTGDFNTEQRAVNLPSAGVGVVLNRNETELDDTNNIHDLPSNHSVETDTIEPSTAGLVGNVVKVPRRKRKNRKTPVLLRGINVVLKSTKNRSVEKYPKRLVEASETLKSLNSFLSERGVKRGIATARTLLKSATKDAKAGINTAEIKRLSKQLKKQKAAKRRLQVDLEAQKQLNSAQNATAKHMAIGNGQDVTPVTQWRQTALVFDKEIKVIRGNPKIEKRMLKRVNMQRQLEGKEKLTRKEYDAELAEVNKSGLPFKATDLIFLCPTVDCATFRRGSLRMETHRCATPPPTKKPKVDLTAEHLHDWQNQLVNVVVINEDHLVGLNFYEKDVVPPGEKRKIKTRPMPVNQTIRDRITLEFIRYCELYRKKYPAKIVDDY